MSDENSGSESRGPVLLCFDGSEDSAAAIAAAGRLFAPTRALVLSVWVPIAVWEPYDPATILAAPLEKLAAGALQLDEIAEEIAQKKAARGAELAVAAGFQAEPRAAGGKAWKVICDVAGEAGAEAIVLGSRGLGRVSGALLGSVSSAVTVHALRPVLIVPREHGDG